MLTAFGSVSNVTNCVVQTLSFIWQTLPLFYIYHRSILFPLTIFLQIFVRTRIRFSSNAAGGQNSKTDLQGYVSSEGSSGECSVCLFQLREATCILGSWPLLLFQVQQSSSLESQSQLQCPALTPTSASIISPPLTLLLPWFLC